eukprot:Hpha_TRINITY_DN28969_c0_g1::TRINITY_DN28969_c0_g1_i1::g.19467::m.19467
MAGKVVLGCDVGGTNTDCAVLSLPDGEVLGKHKATTTPDVVTGVVNGVQEALKRAGVGGERVEYLSIGTTHFVNAVITSSPELVPVVVLRACGPASRALPPCTTFPAELKKLVFHSHAFLNGGFEVDGNEISEFEEETVRGQVKEALAGPYKSGVRQVVVCGCFASAKPEHELKINEIIGKEFPECQVTLSHRIGSLGMLDRENAAVLNAAIQPLAAKTITAFKESLGGANLSCKLFLTQNDGTLMTAEDAVALPVLCASSGPTNSMRGAAFLTKVLDAIVVDIGGTTADVGALVKGFPRPCTATTQIAGVRTNFRMPDVVSIGLGGGSHVVE